MENPKTKMPVLFVGHGSPMNAIGNNLFTKTLNQKGLSLPKPKAILCISAHWLSRGTFVNVSPYPKMIYDMGGFPKELYEIVYPAQGSPETAKEVQKLGSKTPIWEDLNWGFDHGNWSVMRHLFPKADIPVFQMSIAYDKPMQYHYDLANELKNLREMGVLIIGSGNVTHNLSRVDFSGENAPVQSWAKEFDESVKRLLNQENHIELIHYQNIGKTALEAVPEPSHFIPLIYAIGLQEKGETISHFFEEFQYGTLSMRCFQIGN